MVVHGFKGVLQILELSIESGSILVVSKDGLTHSLGESMSALAPGNPLVDLGLLEWVSTSEV